MSNLVIISGDFSSGSTLMFTLFRKMNEYYCLYEPLHENLLEYLLWPLKVDEHHFFVDDYFTEYKGMREIHQLFNPKWGSSNLHLPASDEADDLYRYFSYLIGAAFARSSKVMLKENRLTFRLGWVRKNFPHAKIIHIHREKQSQWNSVVRRAQAHVGREDVGQQDVGFNGFSIATWCEDLKSTFPELDAKNSQTGYERFCKLWELSYAENLRHADISVDYWALTHDFETTCEEIKKCIGGSFDVASLKQYVIPPEKQKQLEIKQPGLRRRTQNLWERAGRKYSKARLLAQSLMHEKRDSAKTASNSLAEREHK